MHAHRSYHKMKGCLHTSASLLLAQGVPLETVSRRLGHANSNITKDIYIHITEKMKKKEEEILQEVKII